MKIYSFIYIRDKHNAHTLYIYVKYLRPICTIKNIAHMNIKR